MREVVSCFSERVSAHYMRMDVLMYLPTCAMAFMNNQIQHL